jgi:hypothetical protein
MSTTRVGGARTPRPKSTGPGLLYHMLQMYVSNVSDDLQVFRIDVAKLGRDVAYVASVSETCYKCLFKIFHLF